MSTYQEIQDRINEEYLNRGTFITEVKTGIKAAIRRYEYRDVEFNQTSTAVASTISQSFIEFPSNHLATLNLRITVNGQNLKMERRDRAWLNARDDGITTGQPTDYATYRNRINLYPTPVDAVYAFPLHYIKRLPALSAQTDTNGWITGMWEDVIVYHAAKVVWAVALRNEKEAAKFAALEREALLAAQAAGVQQDANRITPTTF